MSKLSAAETAKARADCRFLTVVATIIREKGLAHHDAERVAEHIILDIREVEVEAKGVRW